MKEEYRAIDTKIEYKGPNGRNNVQEKRAPIDLDHLSLEHCSHTRLREVHEGANILYRSFSYIASNTDPDCGQTLPETNCKRHNASGKGPVHLCLDVYTVARHLLTPG